MKEIPYQYELTYTTYDPVNAGLLDEQMADVLLDEFRQSYTPSFPFVVVPPNVSANVLRRSQPFLFHAIMTIVGTQPALPRMSEPVEGRAPTGVGRPLRILLVEDFVDNVQSQQND